MERMIQPGEVYSERILSEKLINATDNLLPNTGYTLTLEGMQPSLLHHKELEAFFGSPLDREAGATITLSFDTLEDSLVLNQLDYPIDNANGTAHLFRTQANTYVPSIEMNDTTYAARHSMLDTETVQRLMENFGVTDAPTTDIAAYHEWRDALLERTAGWHLIEQVEIPQAITDVSMQFATLRREEIINLQQLGMAQRRSFIQTIVQFDDNDDARHHTEETLELDGEYTTNHAKLFLKSYTKTPESPFVDYADVISNVRLQGMAFTETSFTSTKKALEEIAAMQRATQARP